MSIWFEKIHRGTRFHAFVVSLGEVSVSGGHTNAFSEKAVQTMKKLHMRYTPDFMPL